MSKNVESNQTAPIGVSVVVFNQDKSVLLGERLKDPNRGMLVAPGGKQNPGDHSPEDTAKREVYEEAGIAIKGLKELMEDPPNSDDFVHRITFTAEAVDPENLQGGGDLGNPRFYSENEIVGLNQTDKISPVVLPALEKAGLEIA